MATTLYPYPVEPTLAAIDENDSDIKQTIRSNFVQIQVYLSNLRDWYCWVVRCSAKKGHFDNDRSVELQCLLKITCKDINKQIGDKIGRLNKLTPEDVSYIKNVYTALKYYNNLHQSFAIQYIPLVVMSECLGQKVETSNNKPSNTRVIAKGSVLTDVTVFSRASLRNIKTASSPVRSKKELEKVNNMTANKTGILDVLMSIIPNVDSESSDDSDDSDNSDDWS